MKLKYLTLSLLGLIFVACNGSEQSQDQATKEVEKPQVCVYEFNPDATTIGWTAFKFTEKTGVSGKFDEFNVLTTQNSEDMLQTLANATFTIPVSSVNSENPERDKKIDSLFFGVMEGTEVISGVVKSIDDQKATVEISMNNVSKDYEGTISVEGDKVTFTTTINLDDFEAQPAVENLNTACKDLHTGTDGVSKLWSEVDIKVETTLTKTCE
jgi:polyisoprenoid-binding protein YceI